MTLNLNPANFSGLGALAGKSNGGGGLSVPGALGLEALRTKLSKEEALRKEALERQQMALQAELAHNSLTQQGELALRQQGIQREQMGMEQQAMQQKGLLAQQQIGQQNSQFQQSLGLDQQKLGQQGQQFQQSLGLDQQKLGFAAKQAEQQKAAEEQQREMARLLDEKKESIQEKGAFASYARLAMQKVKTPEEGQQLRTEILKEAVEKGHITPEEAKNTGRLPLSQFNSLLEYKILQYGKVKEFKTMAELNKPEEPKSDKGGSTIIKQADGTEIILNTPTTPTATAAQKELKDRQKGLQKLATMRDEFNENYFTYAGQAKTGLSEIAEKAKGLPGVGTALNTAAEIATGKDAEGRSKDIIGQTKYLNSVEQFFNEYKHEITGAAAAEKEIKQIRKSFLNGDMSPSQFQGALDQLLVKYTSEAEFNKNILNKGLDTSPDDIKKYLEYNMEKYGWTEEETRRKLKAKGILK